ncbi:hypothetical protein HYU94_03805 [Candidatus Daviesbacteria bacterium]|nr:hypothetical protein [Candidatus Daviesbacteria bacterium]
MKSPGRNRVRKYHHIAHVLNDVTPHIIRWCTPSIDPGSKKVLAPYLSDISVSYQSLGIPSIPSGIFAKAHAKAAKAYGSDRTLFSVNGSTGSNFVVLRALSRQIPFIKVLAMRNIHKSVLFASEDYSINLMFLPPKIDQELQLFLPNTVGEIVDCVKKASPDVLLLTNPSYEGLTLNLKKLIKILRKKFPNLIIFVEEAWGSHLHFSDKLPISAMSAGADICIQSTHKQGGALQQAAMIHWKNARINSDVLIDSYKSITTSSPSFLLLASLDSARHLMEKYGKSKINKLLYIAAQLEKGLNTVPGFNVVALAELKNKHISVFDQDKTKIIVNISGTGMTGYQIAKILEEEFMIIVEKSSESSLLFLVPLQAQIKNVRETIKALKIIVKRYRKNHQNISRLSLMIPQNIIKMREISEIVKLRLDQIEKIHLEKAVGRIAAENISIYPPGIPITIKGEEFTQETIDYYLRCRDHNNCTILAQDQSLKTVAVVK